MGNWARDPHMRSWSASTGLVGGVGSKWGHQHWTGGGRLCAPSRAWEAAGNLLSLGPPRDLKPTNVLLDDEEQPVLMDLGSMNRARIEVKGSREAMAVQVRGSLPKGCRVLQPLSGGGLGSAGGVLEVLGMFLSPAGALLERRPCLTLSHTSHRASCPATPEQPLAPTAEIWAQGEL